jgi:putative transposase
LLAERIFYGEPVGTAVFLLVRHVEVLREAVRQTKEQRPFHIDAWVVLPDHMHTVWTLPPGDDDFSNRWKAIKIRFVQQIPHTQRRSAVRVTNGERGIWQRRFWEHYIRDETDFIRHIDYIHWYPIKHGIVKRVVEWRYSSFHRYLKAGIYPENWTGGLANEVEIIE